MGGEEGLSPGVACGRGIVEVGEAGRGGGGLVVGGLGEGFYLEGGLNCWRRRRRRRSFIMGDWDGL